MELAQIGTKISELWVLYQPLLPILIVSLLLAILLTPAMGRLAAKIGAIDLPAHLRKRTEKGLERNINSQIHPRLGGLGMALAMLITLLVFGKLDDTNWGVLVGIVIIITYGLLDDIRDIPYKFQLLGQFLAASIVVVSGISVHSIQIAGIFIDLTGVMQEVAIGNFIYTFVLPADLVTIVWIMAMINFVNWMSGMDGLNHAVTSVASFLVLLIAVDSGNLLVATLVTAHLGANIGAGLYNYPPAKIFPGAIGEHLNGFLLATFAIMSGSKLPLVLIVLFLPLIDALWVMFNRLRKGAREHRSIGKILQSMTKPDTTHLHHRLMAIGFSWKSVLGIEVGITIGLSAIGFWLSGFRDEFVALIGSISILILVLAAVYTYSRIKEKQVVILRKFQPEPEEAPTIEVVYKNKEDDEKFVY